jgi:hypothetical protein
LKKLVYLKVLSQAINMAVVESSVKPAPKKPVQSELWDKNSNLANLATTGVKAPGGPILAKNAPVFTFPKTKKPCYVYFYSHYA